MGFTLNQLYLLGRGPGLEIVFVVVALAFYLLTAALYGVTRKQRFLDINKLVWGGLLWRVAVLSPLTIVARLLSERGFLAVYLLVWGWPPNMRGCQFAAGVFQVSLSLAFIVWFITSVTCLLKGSTKGVNAAIFWAVAGTAVLSIVLPISSGLLMKFFPLFNPHVRQMVASFEEQSEYGRDEEISSLTVEEAEELVERHKGVTRGGISWPIDLRLVGLKEISKDVAVVLARHEAGLFLDGLQALTPEVADALGDKREGSLRSSFTSTLSLNGINELDEKCATALSKHKGDLRLNGIQHLSVRAADALGAKAAGGHSGLEMYSLTSLSGEAAHGLVGRGEYRLVLTGLREPSVDLLKILSTHKGMLALDGMSELPDGGSKALAGHKGSLSLNSLERLSKKQASDLAEHTGDLFLCGLKTIDLSVAQILAKHSGGVWVMGLTSVPPDAAAVLESNSQFRLKK